VFLLIAHTKKQNKTTSEERSAEVEIINIIPYCGFVKVLQGYNIKELAYYVPLKAQKPKILKR
jgi:hypothetical protein